jgi:hypothetical protein
MFNFTAGEVEKSPDFERIKGLPRRRWDVDAEERNYVKLMSEHFRRPGSNVELRPVQAASLVEMAQNGGLFGPQRVGAGKTLTSLLGFLVLRAQRPVLLLPANLLEKTRRDIQTLSKNWHIPVNVKTISYEMLGHPGHSLDLEHDTPDVIIADECHKLKSTDAAVTARVKRYMQKNPRTKFVALSGTMLRNSMEEYFHLIRWCLKERAPVPFDLSEQKAWCGCLDPKKPMDGMSVKPGVLVELCNKEELAIYAEDPTRAVRIAFRRRLNETPGVVATEEGALQTRSGTGVMSLNIDSINVELPGIKDIVSDLKREKLHPDGYTCIDKIEVWRHLRELSCGFYYRWNPLPPAAWRAARSAWASFVGEELKRHELLDTEGQIINLIKTGEIVSPEYDAWQAEQKRPQPDTGEPFVINTEAVWVDEGMLHACAKWLKQNVGICWVEHIEFGKKLAEITGLPYYASGGINQHGTDIVEDFPDKDKQGNPSPPAKKSIIASIAANATGKNLQVFKKNLLPLTPMSSSTWEQLLGRTHRDGQQADEVSATLLIAMKEQVIWYELAIEVARNVSDMSGQEQKLCYATSTVVLRENAPSGA